VPEAAEVLHTLQKQNHHCAIVTSAWRKLAEIRTIAAGLPVPKVIVPVDEIRNGKPEGSLRAAEKLGVAPEDADSHLPGDQQGEEKEKRTEPDGIRFRSISLDGKRMANLPHLGSCCEPAYSSSHQKVEENVQLESVCEPR
jgi:hypothetical protein